MISFKKTFAAAAATGMMLMNLATPAFAADHETFFGNADYVSPGHDSLRAVETISDTGEVEPYGGIHFEIPADTTFADLDTLSTWYNVMDDDCYGGSPRFQLNIDSDGDGISDGNVFVYIGPSPSFTDCELGWQYTEELIGNDDPGRYDTSQLGGTTSSTYTDALSLVGSYDVVGIQLVTDSGWATTEFPDGEQTILFDDTNIDGTMYDYEQTSEELKESCKKGGWMTMSDEDNNPFRNQGQCVSHYARMMN